MNVDEVHTIAWVQSRSVTVGKQLKVTKVNIIAIGNLNYVFKKITCLSSMWVSDINCCQRYNRTFKNVSMKSQVSVIHVTHSSVYCVVVVFNGTQEAEMTGSHYEDIGGDEVSIKTLPEKKKIYHDIKFQQKTVLFFA